MSVTLRPATLADVPALLEIYTYYVNQTAVSFEYVPPTVEEFRGRMERTLRKYPYLVAREGDRILGYTYAGAFYGRAAYDWCCELTVYLDQEARGRGVGRALYGAMEKTLGEMGVQNLYACVAECEEEDEYLTHGSARFHARMGFREVGRFRKCGYKFGRWYDMIWMEKLIGAHEESPKPVGHFQ